MSEAQQPPEEEGTTTTSISNTGTDTNTGATSASATTTTSSPSSPYRSQRPGGEQSYRLKTVRYHNNDRKILLQNENGPCPLLAAANALLLRGAISLPPACIRNGIASLNDLVNVLGLKAMNNPRLLAASESSSSTSATTGTGAEEQPKQSSTTVAAAAATTTTTTTTTSVEDTKSPPSPVAAPASEFKGTIVELPPPISSSSSPSPKEDNSAKAEVVAPAPTKEESTQQSATASAEVEVQQHQEQKSQQPEQQQQHHNEYAAHLITEVLDLLPTLQDGMDVNPKFTVGVTGYEYTKQLTAFDLLNVELVHGWLIDPEHNKEVYDIVGNRTYNELITNVIQGNEAGIEIDKVQSQIIQLQKQIEEKQLQLIEQEKEKGGSNNENVTIATTTISTTNAPSSPNAEDDNNKNDSDVSAEAVNESQVGEEEQQKEWVEVTKVDSEPAEAATITTATTTATASITSTITTTITDSNTSITTSTNEEAKIAANTNNTEGKEDDGEHTLEQLQTELEKLQQRHIEMNQEITSGALINDFFNTSCHQLTHFGLTQLYDHLKENDLCVFFRNNHFATITKSSDGLLYLLVTDLGYANVSNVVWETLDVIDGDTDYVDSNFSKSPLQDTIGGSTEGTTLTPEQLLAQSGQNEADYQLALRMSMQDGGGNSTNNGTTTTTATNNNNLQASLDDEEGRLIAAATEASIREYNGIPSTPAVTTNNAASPANTPNTAAATTATTASAATPGTTTTTNTSSTPVSANTQSAIDEQMIALESIRMSLDNNNNNNNSNSAATQGGNNQSSGSSTGYGGVGGLLPGCTTQEESDRLLAMQIESQLQNDEASLRLARQLQAEENALQQQRRQLQQSNNNGNNNTTATTGRPQQTTTTAAAAGGGGGSGATNNNCIIS